LSISSFFRCGCDNKSTKFAKQFKECEDIVENSNLCWTVIRCVLFQETVLNFIDFDPDGSLSLAILEGKFCPVTLRDIAEVAATILLGRPRDHAYKIYNLTGPELLSGKDIAHIVSELVEEEIRFVSPSAKEMSKLWRQIGCDEFGCDGFNELLNSIANNQMCLCSLDSESLLARKATPISKTARACKNFIKDKKSKQSQKQKQFAAQEKEKGKAATEKEQAIGKEKATEKEEGKEHGVLHEKEVKEKGRFKEKEEAKRKEQAKGAEQAKGTEQAKGAEYRKEKEQGKEKEQLTEKEKMKRAPQSIRIWPN